MRGLILEKFEIHIVIEILIYLVYTWEWKLRLGRDIIFNDIGDAEIK